MSALGEWIAKALIPEWLRACARDMCKTTMPKPRTNWQTAETVFVTIATCPSCGGTKHDSHRSCANGDGSTIRLVTCRGCRLPFKIVAEFPENGNPKTPIGKISP